MREILFRGKSNWADRNVKEGDWIYSMTISRHCYNDKEITSYYIGSGNKTIDGKTLGQYTGLTDKNGKKIFEGDIVKCTDTIGNYDFIAVVLFGNPNSNYDWGFQLKRISGAGANTDILLWVETEETGAFIEVIGNIHDNPELLSGDTNVLS